MNPVLSSRPSLAALPLLLRTLLAALALALVVPVLAAAPAGAVIEDYASYEPQKRCSPNAKAGTVLLAGWLVRSFGGGNGSISRSCGSGGTSEHKEGRAIDWMANASNPADVKRVQRFFDKVFATSPGGQEHAWARRMGIMYVIWDDRIYSSWNQFAGDPYLSSSCKRRKRCSPTLRHRDHVHVSLTRRGAKGLTSWYVPRLNRRR
ncbi:hypothetical protein [Nocardioides pacificus]